MKVLKYCRHRLFKLFKTRRKIEFLRTQVDNGNFHKEVKDKVNEIIKLLNRG